MLKFFYRIFFLFFLGAWVDDNGLDHSINYVKSSDCVGCLQKARSIFCWFFGQKILHDLRKDVAFYSLK
jgi:hypothetical protein